MFSLVPGTFVTRVLWRRDLVYKLKKFFGTNTFSAQFIRIISHFKRIGYNNYVFQQTACLVVNPITVGDFAFLINSTSTGGPQTL